MNAPARTMNERHAFGPTGAEVAAGNPFVEISRNQWLILVTLYVALKVIIPAALVIKLDVGGNTLSQIAADVLHGFVLILPLLVARERLGWLHPLVFAPLWAFAKSMPRDFAGVVTLFTVAPERVTASDPYLMMAGVSDLGVASLAASLLGVIGLFAYYCGYAFGPKLRVPSLLPQQLRAPESKLFAAAACAALVGVAYILSRGGVTAFMSAWQGGRYQALQNDGLIQVLVRTMSVTVFVWYAIRPHAVRNPLFLGSIAAATGLVFITSGSRALIVYLFVLIVMTWMLRHRRLPLLRAAMLGAAALAALSFLGDIRAAARTTGRITAERSEVDVMVRDVVGEMEQRAYADPQARVVGSVMSGDPLLWGESYVGAALFFIPRSLWPAKPRAAGALFVERLFGGGGYGIPIGPVAEAFWNFHIPGVLVLFGLYGVFHRWLARLLEFGSESPTIWAFYVPTLFLLRPGGESFVPYVHFMVPALFLLVWTGALRLRAPGRAKTAPAGLHRTVG